MAPMTNEKNEDPVWQSAWAWVRRQHVPAGHDEAAREEFARWLAADPVHSKTFEEASQLWLLVGLVPPAHDVPIPDIDDLTP